MTFAAAEAGQIYGRGTHVSYGHGHYSESLAQPKPSYGSALGSHYYGKRSADPLLHGVYPIYKREAEADCHRIGYLHGYRKREAKPEPAGPAAILLLKPLLAFKLLQQSQRNMDKRSAR